MEGVSKVLAGSEHCLSLTEEGRVWSWGWNEHNNCGLGDTQPQPLSPHLSGFNFRLVNIAVSVRIVPDC